LCQKQGSHQEDQQRVEGLKPGHRDHSRAGVAINAYIRPQCNRVANLLVRTAEYGYSHAYSKQQQESRFGVA
jgi:hypothetical protein